MASHSVDIDWDVSTEVLGMVLIILILWKMKFNLLAKLSCEVVNNYS